jgi:UDP:flavonoid glycosyltransferase YjiC (YdhE family)
MGEAPTLGHLAVLTAPLPGHLNPLQALGAQLRALGWRMSVVHLAPARSAVAQLGLDFTDLPGRSEASYAAYLAALAEPAGPVGLRRMIRATAAITDQLLEEAPAVLEDMGATAVLADAVEPAGPLIAARLGLRSAIAVTGLPLLREADVPPPFVNWRYRPDGWGRFRNRAGNAVTDRLLRPVAAVMSSKARAWRLHDVDASDLVHVAQCPRELDFPRRDLPPGFYYGSPWRSPDTRPAPLPVDDRPLIFCSLGTLQGARLPMFAAMASACAGVGARAVIGHGGRLSPADEASLPGDPLVRAFWPQQAVLSRCAAAILHAGFNTVLDALAAGVPIVAVPIGFEQPATAARIARIGAGRMLSPRRADARTLAGALRAVLEDPSYRAAAGRMAAVMSAGDGAARAAAIITAALTSRD